MNKKICINKKILLIISVIFTVFFLSLLINSTLKSKTIYKSEAAPAKVYGGTEVTDPKKWPFMVRILDYSGSGICGGTLIAPRWVLTAAHCNVNRYNNEIFIGSNDLKAKIKPYTIKKTFTHPYYDCFNFLCDHYVNDIALIELEDKVPNVQTISLNTIPTFHTEGEGVLEVVTGWGMTENVIVSRILLQAVLPVLSNERANKKDWYHGEVSSSEIASGYPLGGVGQCAGDSGGPNLVWDGNKWIQVGIFTWNNKSFSKICGAPKKPGIGTRLSYSGLVSGDSIKGKFINYIQWIKDTIKNETGEIYTGNGTFIGKDLTPDEKKEFIKRIWINKELEADSLQP